MATLARAWANITTLLLAVLAAALFTAPATLEREDRARPGFQGRICEYGPAVLQCTGLPRPPGPDRTDDVLASRRKPDRT